MTAWYAVYTRAKSESLAQEHLRRQGYEVYLPSHMKRRRHARRSDFVRVPLFPRYLFVAIDRLQQRWSPIRSTVGVYDLVRRGDLPAEVPEGLVEELQAREHDGGFDHDAQIQKIKLGDSVRIAAGPFADLVGRFYGVASEERVFVLLDLLGRSVKAQLPSTAIDPV